MRNKSFYQILIFIYCFHSSTTIFHFFSSIVFDFLSGVCVGEKIYKIKIPEKKKIKKKGITGEKLEKSTPNESFHFAGIIYY